MVAFTASSVNLGNSFRYWGNVIASLARRSALGTSRDPAGQARRGDARAVGLYAFRAHDGGGTVMAGLWSEPPAWREILRGKRSTTFSLKR
jgi:hypothetical protein